MTPRSPAASGRRGIASDAPCPCGSGERFDGCCGPLLDGAPAPRPEALMRSRYTAFALGDAPHLRESWHPGTRPDTIDLDAATRWIRLEILDVEGGGRDDRRGTVEFRAWYRDPGRPETSLHERSRFVRQSGRWWYLDGAVR
ncbi:YchJ family protein [Microbacterium sp. P03]|uniref:YchJ family protein n=1 Tax=Microbacterium sp. P03 TaxID=3366946 RepID=UPI00374554FA